MRNRIVVLAFSSVIVTLAGCSQFGPSDDTLDDVHVVDDGTLDVNVSDTPDDSVQDILNNDDGKDIPISDVSDVQEPFPDIPPIECSSNLACERAFDDLPTCWHAFCDEWLNICLVAPEVDGTTCQIGDKCIKDSTCMAGACIGSTMSCDDGNPCTTDSCNPKLGCSNQNNTAACSDGNPCTDGDICNNGVCRAGLNSCSCAGDGDCEQYDDNDLCNGQIRCIGDKCVIDQTTVRKCAASQDSCIANACDPATGFCRETPANQGSICDDEDPCTINDVCRDGVCAGNPTECDDGNPCTTDLCNQISGCSHEYNTESCDDGNACTSDDVCAFGACVGTRQVECGCILDADCAPLEDGNPCNGRLNCVDHICVVDPATVVRCTDPFGKPCQRSACNPATGRCAVVNLPDNRPCVDDNSCTFDEYCSQGECVGTEIPCNDGNLCTEDFCDQYGGCFHSYNTAPCEDGDPCSVEDHCLNGSCTPGTDRECDDGKPCTLDLCSPTIGCYTTPITEPDIPCTTTDPCIIGATCQNGLCVGERRDCEDGDPCTDNYCDSNDGLCKKRNNSAPCEDGNFCTVNDYCKTGVCTGGSARDCSDTDPCTADFCVSGTGCVNDQITGCQHCPSGLDSECDSPYVCKVGICDMSTDPLGRCVWIADPCDDGNTCTSGVCNEFTGVCSYTALSGPCDDSNPCTLNDQCNVSTRMCVGVAVTCNDNNICTDDYCDTADGICKTTPNSAPCDDGDPCTVEDTCSGGTCSISTTMNCEDGDPCTDNFCDPFSGLCHQTVNSADCEDSDPCTVGDYCELGQCLTGSPKYCGDGNECTNDSCRADDGECLHEANTGAACGASNKCILSGVCNSEGSCDAVYKTCNDNNVCTTDSCVPSTGNCLFSPNTLGCDDSNACTVNDKCFSSVCSGTELTCNDDIDCTLDSCDTATGCVFEPRNDQCDDGNECTTDVCDPLLGCVNTPLDNAGAWECSDDNPCTLTDTCVDGQCVGTPKNCADTLICTKDTCNSVTGACENTYFTGPCDDGNPCTAGETCNTGGVCGNGTTVTCSDGIACTTDYCQQGVGCVFAPIDSACNDQNLCTQDLCLPGSGCQHPPVTIPTSCDDNSACTSGDTCDLNLGTCVGKIKDCDDSNVCTTDSCNTSTGACVHSPAASVCDDNLGCTTGDYCISGQCLGFATIDCGQSACADDPRCL